MNRSRPLPRRAVRGHVGLRRIARGPTSAARIPFADIACGGAAPCQAGRHCNSGYRCCDRDRLCDAVATRRSVGIRTRAGRCSAGRHAFQHRRLRLLGDLRRDAAAHDQRSGTGRADHDGVQHRYSVTQRHHALAGYRFARPSGVPGRWCGGPAARCLAPAQSRACLVQGGGWRAPDDLCNLCAFEAAGDDHLRQSHGGRRRRVSRRHHRRSGRLSRRRRDDLVRHEGPGQTTPAWHLSALHPSYAGAGASADPGRSINRLATRWPGL